MLRKFLRTEIFLVIFLSAGTLSTKSAGAAWLLLALMGAHALWRSFRSGRDKKFPNFDSTPNGNNFPVHLAYIFLLTTFAAFLLRIPPIAYWNDPLGERHAEMRLLIGAIGTYGICIYKWPMGISAGRALTSVMGNGLALGCSVSLGIAVFTSGEAIPTNRIPWAVAIAMMSCFLLALSQCTISRLQRYFWLAGSLCGLLTVLATDSRGAYGLIFCWPLLLAYSLQLSSRSSKQEKNILVYSIIIGLAALLIIPSQFKEKPLQRVQIAWSEIKISVLRDQMEVSSNTSVGARIYMWERSLMAISESFWIGYGHDGRKAEIKRWGAEADTPVVESLGHVHNEYLQSMMDHGLWGLVSLLSYSVGIALVTYKLSMSKPKNHKILAASALCLLFLHITAGLTNMNFAHNYYPIILSLVMTGIILASFKDSFSTAGSKILTLSA